MKLQGGKRAFVCTCALLAAVAMLPLEAWGASSAPWPTRQVTIVTGYAPGSGVDAVARFLADGLRSRTGQPFIVENKVGAIGNIAGEFVAHSSADGYMALFAPNSMAINPYLFKRVGFDAIHDFQTVTTVLKAKYLLVVNPNVVPVNNVADLTAYIKAHPGTISSGTGNATVEVAAGIYRQLTNSDAVNVRYTGVPQSLTELLGGHIHFVFTDTSPVVSFLKAGKLKALAVTSHERLSSSPEIPTMVEAGVKGYPDITGWEAMFMPAHVPADIVNTFADYCNAIIKSEAGVAFLAKFGGEPFPNSPENAQKFLISEHQKWGPLVKAAGLEQH